MFKHCKIHDDAMNNNVFAYANDYRVSSGSDCGWVDKLNMGSSGLSGAIAEAQDAPSLTFTPSGNQNWYETTNDFYYTGSSITVPAVLSQYLQSDMETNI